MKRPTTLNREGAPDSGSEDSIHIETEAEDDRETSEERAVRCAACSEEITSDSHRRHVDGKFEHCFANPAGLLYCIGCFGEAPGCVPHGEETDEFTWFPGYAWQLALCSGCGSHLGWRYWSEGDSFYGLILDRLEQG